MKKIFSIIIIVILTASSIIFSGSEEIKEGKELFTVKCNKCHPLSRPLQQNKNLKEWKETTKIMADKSMGEILETDAEKVAEYLNSLNPPAEKTEE